MDIILWVTIFFSLFAIIVYAISGSIKKSIRYTLAIFAILSLITISIIFIDSKQLLNMSKSNSLFIYTANNQPEFSIIVDFSNSTSITLTKNQTNEKYLQFIEKSPELKQAYFRTFIFSDDSLKDLLPEEIYFSDDIQISKNEVLEGIKSKNLEDKTSFFTVALFNIFQGLKEEEKMISFLNHYKANKIQIYPKIKAISILSIMPETLIKVVMK